MSRFKIVTFDITGTLLKFRRPIGEIYGSVGARFGIKADPETLSRNFKLGWTSMNARYPNYGLGSGMGWEEWWKKLVFLSFGAVHDTGDALDTRGEALDQISECLIALFRTGECWRLADGALPLLESLRDRNIAAGVISNFDVRLHEIIEDLKLRRYFAFVTSSYEASHLKPDVAIFRRAEEAYERATGNRFERRRALHVGDSPSCDYMGALNSGWNGALICSNVEGSKVDLSEISPDRVFENLKKLKVYLEK